MQFIVTPRTLLFDGGGLTPSTWWYSQRCILNLTDRYIVRNHFCVGFENHFLQLTFHVTLVCRVWELSLWVEQKKKSKMEKNIRKLLNVQTSVVPIFSWTQELLKKIKLLENNGQFILWTFFYEFPRNNEFWKLFPVYISFFFLFLIFFYFIWNNSKLNENFVWFYILLQPIKFFHRHCRSKIKIKIK